MKWKLKQKRKKGASVLKNKPKRIRADFSKVSVNSYPTSLRVTRSGLVVSFVVIILSAIILLYNLVHVQIFQHDEYKKEAAMLHYTKVPVYPQRGEIYDNEGVPLAISDYEYTVGMTASAVRSWADEDQEVSREAITDKLASLLEIDKAEMTAYMADEESVYTQLKKHVTAATIADLRNYLRQHHISGVVIDTVMTRKYPENDTGGAIIGFATKLEDNIEGVIGLEAYYEDELKGVPGYSYSQVDNYSGMQLPFTDALIQEPVQGYNLKLNINARLQQYCQKIIAQYAEAYEANAGELLVVNAKTGAVLALANSRSFDLNEPYAAPSDKSEKKWDPFDNKDDMEFLYDDVWLNRASSILYEPGSTYKALTVSMAIAEKVTTDDELFNDQPIWVEGYDAAPISCWSGGGHGMITMQTALTLSCNPVMVQLAERIGIDKFYDYVRAYGHRDKTGIDLPGEVMPILHEDPALINMATWSFGESAGITPLHLVMAYAALSNDGVLMKPQVVDKILDSDGNVVKEIEPEAVRQVISEETSDKTLNYMRTAMLDSYEWRDTPGYGSGAKTSTSNWGINDENAVISFASVTPALDPNVIVMSVLHEPRDGTYSSTLSHLNSYAASLAMEVLNIPRDSDSDSVGQLFIQGRVPDLKNLDYKRAGGNIMYYGLVLDKEPHAPKDAVIKYQYPNPDEVINNRATIYVSYSGTPMTEKVVVPSFVGMSYEAAYKMAEEVGVNIDLDGYYEAKVESQSIDPGTSVLKYTVIKLWMN